MNGLGIDKVQLIFPTDMVKLKRGYNHCEGWSSRVKYIESEELGAYAVERDYYSDIKLRTGNLTMKLENETLAPRLSVLFNPTTCLHDFALTTDMKKVRDIVQDAIYQSGIDVDILQGNCKRIDVTKDRILSERADNYVSPLASFLSFKRQSTKLEYDNGVTLGSQSKQLGFYNRHAKLEKDGLLNNAIFHPNTARLEYRLLSKGKRTWTDTYGLHTFQDVVSASPDQFNSIFVDGLKNVGLRGKLTKEEELDMSTIRPVSLITTMEDYEATFGRNWLQTFYSHMGLISLVDKYGLDTLVIALSEVDVNKSSKMERSRIKAKIENALKVNKQLTNEKTPLDYIHEFYERFKEAV